MSISHASTALQRKWLKTRVCPPVCPPVCLSERDLHVCLPALPNNMPGEVHRCPSKLKSCQLSKKCAALLCVAWLVSCKQAGRTAVCPSFDPSSSQQHIFSEDFDLDRQLASLPSWLLNIIIAPKKFIDQSEVFSFFSLSVKNPKKDSQVDSWLHKCFPSTWRDNIISKPKPKKQLVVLGFLFFVCRHYYSVVLNSVQPYNSPVCRLEPATDTQKNTLT